MKEELKRIFVEWKDTTFYNGHYNLDDAKEYGFKTFETIGYLIQETKEFIQIAVSKETTEEDTISDFYIIPNGCIIKKIFLK